MMGWRQILSWEVEPDSPGLRVGDRVYCDVASLGPRHHATIKKVKPESNGSWVMLTFDNPRIQYEKGDFLFWHENIIPLFAA